jgi:hypothetical protein
VVGYGPFSLCVIHKEGPYLSNGDIDRLMMIVNFILFAVHLILISMAVCERFLVDDLPTFNRMRCGGCLRIYFPVCGTDNVTYTNECRFRCYNRRKKVKIDRCVN